jgi:hypothetical protein
MVLYDIEKQIIEIRKIKLDYEAAHSKEDQLYIDVLGFIADGNCGNLEQAETFAREALKASRIKFPRYTA